MIIEKRARPTLTAVELDIADELHFTLVNGVTRRIRLLEASACVWRSNLGKLPKPGPSAKVVLQMGCRLEVDGHPVSLIRWVGASPH